MAEKLKCRPADIEQWPYEELFEWDAYLEVKAEKEKKAHDDAKRKAGASAPPKRGGGRTLGGRR